MTLSGRLQLEFGGIHYGFYGVIPTSLLLLNSVTPFLHNLD